MPTPLTFLLRSDNPAVVADIQTRLADSFILHSLHLVSDDAALFAYLQRKERYEDPRCAPRPDLLLLDLDSMEETVPSLLASLRHVPSLDHNTIVLMSRSDPERLLGPSLTLADYAFLRLPMTLRGLLRLLSARE